MRQIGLQCKRTQSGAQRCARHGSALGAPAWLSKSVQKIIELKALITQKNTNTLIQIDGGVTLLNAPEILAAGAYVLVAGNTVFKSENPTQTIAALKAL
jgi:ribulose-phosphate 3-epimerase